MKNCLLFLSILFMSSCLNQQILVLDPAIPEHIDFVRNALRLLIDQRTEDGYARAAVILSKETNRKRIDTDEAEVFWSEILEGYHEIILPSSQYNYNTMLLYAQKSTKDFSYLELLPVKSIGENLFSFAEEHRLRGERTLALHYLSRSINHLNRYWFRDQELTLSTLLWYIDVAREYHNVPILDNLLNVVEHNYSLNDNTMKILSEYKLFLDQGWKVEYSIGASVTVWVDMGVRVEKNLGFPERSIGTGFYVDPAGYIITNYHVIASEVDPEYEGKSELFIRPGNSPELRIPAVVVGYDRIFDIALIKAEIEAPIALSLSPNSILVAGNQLYVVGSPGGLENSITSGIVSATGRRFLQMGDYLQVDVPVNPGNSGGPMFDMEGGLVGVVFAGIEQFEGVNFAIPSAWIQYFFHQLFGEGEVVHPWFGLALRENKGKVTVVYVYPDSPAEQAGFKVDEVIVSINGLEVYSILEMQELLLSNGVGKLYMIGIKSDQNIQRLVYSNTRPYSPLENIIDDKLVDAWLPLLFGMEVVVFGEKRKGYTITEVFPGSIADESGLSENDSFRLLNWFLLPEQKLAVLQLRMKKQANGYLEEGLQLTSYLQINQFL